MPPLIEHPSDCEIRYVIRYLNAKGDKAVEIHRNICEVYGQNKMRDGMVREWVRALKMAERTFMTRNEVGDNQ